MQEYGSSLKFVFPQISVLFSIRKKLGMKNYFPLNKKHVLTRQNEGLTENCSS